MAEPWFDEITFGILVGAVGGGVGGTLAGLWGGLVGMFAPRGKGRAWLIAIGWGFVGLGVVSLAFGLCALAAGQPYGIWYPSCMVGAILGGVVGGLMPVVYKRYAEAEARRLQAEEFRGQ
jgi:H+/Cl- antiporter ClcA